MRSPSLIRRFAICGGVFALRLSSGSSGAEVNDIVNRSAIAVVEAQEGEQPDSPGSATGQAPK